MCISSAKVSMVYHLLFYTGANLSATLLCPRPAGRFLSLTLLHSLGCGYLQTALPLPASECGTHTGKTQRENVSFLSYYLSSECGTHTGKTERENVSFLSHYLSSDCETHTGKTQRENVSFLSYYLSFRDS